MQQFIEARAMFTADENYEEDWRKENEDDVMSIFKRTNSEHWGKKRLTLASIKDEQSRVEYLAHAHVLNAEQTCWKQDCDRMEDQGEEVSWYSFIGNLNPGRHEYEAVNNGMIKATAATAEYDALYTSKCKVGIDNEDADTAYTQWSAELENMNYDLFTGSVLHSLCCTSELETIEEKFEDDDAHGPYAEDLWYLSLKAKIKRAYNSGGVLVVSSKGERTELSLGIAHAFA